MNILAQHYGTARVEAWSKPAEEGEIGGDFIIREERPGFIAVALGDATGHDQVAAKMARFVRPWISRGIRFPISEDLIRGWHERVYRRYGRQDLFVCLTILQLDLADRTLTIANAGNPDVLIRRNRYRVLERFSSTGMPLGLLHPDEWNPPQIQRATLGPWDCSFCFSDGVVDGLGANGERFGLQRVVAAARAANANSLLRGLRLELRRFLSPTAEQDDLSLLALGMCREQVA